MESRNNLPVVILLSLVLAVLVVLCIILAPQTLGAYETLNTEKNATPTPTSDNRNMMAVTPDPNATPAPTMLVLKVGVEGDQVMRLQERLKKLGYYSGEVDGQFGQGTAEAVKLFQSQHGIAADGLAGEETRNLLYSEAAQIFVPTPVPTSTPSTLSMGDDHDGVRAAQQRLKDLGYLDGNVDGDFGAGTKAAVMWFQRQNGLEEDGIIGGSTMALLFAENAPKAQPTPTPDPNAMPILVNKTHPVEENYKPSDLVNMRKYMPSDLIYVKGSECEGDRTAADALIVMLKAAKEDGVTGWQLNAGYRSIRYQQSLMDDKVAGYLERNPSWSRSKAKSAASQTVAEPGTSEHHTGLAFDVAAKGADAFIGTPQQKWLAKNCWDYGFIIRYQEDKEDITGFVAECWHIRYVGVQHSVPMRDKNLCLEEYLGEVD